MSDFNDENAHEAAEIRAMVETHSATVDRFGYNLSETSGEHIRNAIQLLDTARDWTTPTHGDVHVFWPSDFEALRDRLFAALGAQTRELEASAAARERLLAHVDALSGPARIA